MSTPQHFIKPRATVTGRSKVILCSRYAHIDSSMHGFEKQINKWEKNMWQKMSFPNYIADRYIGISLPLENEIAIISYEGIHIINLLDSNKVFTDTDYPEGGELFDHNKNQLSYGHKTYQILGLYGGEPILKNPNGETIELDLKKQKLYIFDSARKRILDFHYDDMSGDWCFSTFSENGQYILLCLPYNFYIFRNEE